MKNNFIVKIVCFAFVSIIVLNFKTYCGIWYNIGADSRHNGSTGTYSERHYKFSKNQKITAKIVEEKLKMDEIKYYFEYNIDFTNIIDISSQNVQIVCSKYDNIDKLTYAYIKRNNTDYISEARFALATSDINEAIYKEYNGDGDLEGLYKYYVLMTCKSKTAPYVYNNYALEKCFYFSELDNHFGEPIRTLSQPYNENEISSTIQKNQNTLIIKIEILKGAIEKYKNLKIVFPQYIYENLNSYNSNYTMAITNNNLNLLNVVNNHEHKFNYGNITNNTHSKICEECEFNITENHNYVYTYDEIHNNMCECEMINKVKIHIKNNIDNFHSTYLGEKNSEFDMLNISNDYENYKIDKYIKYKLSIIEPIASLSQLNYEWIKVDETNEEPNRFDDISTKYEIIYLNKTYTIIYNQENNHNLSINKNKMQNRTVTFSEKYYLDKSEYLIEGYTFLGWSINKKSDKVDFIDNEYIQNKLTNIDNDIINLYPVYSKIVYKIKYNWDKSLIKNSSQLSEEIVNYGENKIIADFSNRLKYYIFEGWFLNDNKISNTSQLDKLVKNDNEIFILKANFNCVKEIQEIKENQTEVETESVNETEIEEETSETQNEYKPIIEETKEEEKEEESQTEEEPKPEAISDSDKKNDGSKSSDNKKDNIFNNLLKNFNKFISLIIAFIINLSHFIISNYVAIMMLSVFIITYSLIKFGLAKKVLEFSMLIFKKKKNESKINYITDYNISDISRVLYIDTRI